MLTIWIIFSILLAITALYFFLSIYILFRLLSGYFLDGTIRRSQP